jgi:hypothetical protein
MENNLKSIFCLTSGTSGSSSLYYIFSLCSNTDSKLSSILDINWNSLYEFYDKGKNEIDKIFKKEIYSKIISSLNSGNRYIQANQYVSFIFIKSACDLLDKNLSIVHLIDNIVNSALSLYSENKIPDINFILSNRNRFKPNFIKYREFSHDFYKSLWFVLELYVKSKDLIVNYRHINHNVFFVKWLNSKIEIRNLLNKLDCKITRKRLESASKIYKEIELNREKKIKNVLEKENAINMARRFIDEFGEGPNLTYDECKELLIL